MLLRKHPGQITYLAPLVTFLMAVMCGTGHTAYSIIPVIVDVSKEHGIRPSRPLSIAVVASQVGVAASPISAAMAALVSAMEPRGVGYLTCLAIVIPTTFVGLAVGAVVASRQGCELEDDRCGGPTWGALRGSSMGAIGQSLLSIQYLSTIRLLTGLSAAGLPL